MDSEKALRLGTRGSALARRQTELVRDALLAAVPGLRVDVSVIETRGDRIQNRPVSAIGDKGVFVRAIEEQLLDGLIDLAVHSLKDVPSDNEVPGLTLVAFSAREDPRDVLVSSSGQTLAELPAGSRIGTSSPRRRALLRAARPELEPLNIRGNVDTRLAKLRAGQYDAIILAAAGLLRLGLEGEITEYLPLDWWLPDAGQGIMAVQGRLGDSASEVALAMDDPVSRLTAAAERSVVRALGADCYSPVGVLARVSGDRIRVDAMAADDDMRNVRRDWYEGSAESAASVGDQLGRRLNPG